MTEQAKDKALIRKIFRAALSELAEMNLTYSPKYIRQVYHHNHGLVTRHHLSKSKRLGKVHHHFVISFETYTFNQHYPEKRIQVRVWGEVSIDVKKPRSFYNKLPIYDKGITFAFDRKFEHQVNAVVKLIAEQDEQRDSVISIMQASLDSWNGFASRVSSLAKSLKISKDDICISHRDTYKMILRLPIAPPRTTKGLIIVNYNGIIDVEIDNFPDHKLSELARIIRA